MSKNKGAVIVAEFQSEQHILRCPVCRCDYVYACEVSALPAGAQDGRLAVRADGIHIDNTSKPIDRGVMIQISFICEGGHFFVDSYHFHKGQTTVTQVSQVTPLESPPPVIWRN